MKILGKKIAATPVEHAARTESGIWLAPSQYSENSECVVRAIGSGIKDATEYKKGSRVYVEMYKATQHKATINGEQFVFLNRSDIVGIDANGRYHPIEDRIMLKPSRSPDSIIQRPENYDEDEGGISYYMVYLVGTGQILKSGERVPFDLKIGDKVITMANIGRDVMAADGVFKLVKYCDILGVIQ